MRRYLQIVRVPDLGRMYAASLLARLPIGINGLAIVLLLRAETGSFGVAGATAGALALGSGLGAPIGGRLIDAFGARLLLPLAGVNAAGLVGLVVLARADAARKRRPHGGRLAWPRRFSARASPAWRPSCSPRQRCSR